MVIAEKFGDKNRQRRQRGFTLIELMIVMMLILILMGIAIPNYQQSVIHARESVLRQDLYHLRQVIDQFTMDKQRAPQSLDELVSAGYLRELPTDPITRSKETWQPVQDDTLASIDQTESGIVDVHSGSPNTASDGSAYNTW